MSGFGTQTSKQRLEGRLARLAARQYGVFSRKQALALGYTSSSIRRRLESKTWLDASPGIYRLPGSREGWHQQLMVAYLIGGEGAYVARRSAAASWELDGFEVGPLEIATTRRIRRGTPATFLRVTPAPEFDTAAKGPFIISAIPRTLIDLAAVTDRHQVEIALDDALRRGLTSLARLKWRLDVLGANGLPGAAIVGQLVRERDPKAPQLESALEVRFLSLIRRAGLPSPTPHHVIRDGSFAARVDFAYPELRLAIEVDGYRFHSGKVRWEHDLRRRNRLQALGWTVLNITADQLTNRPDEVIELIEHSFGAKVLWTFRCQNRTQTSKVGCASRLGA